MSDSNQPVSLGELNDGFDTPATAPALPASAPASEAPEIVQSSVAPPPMPEIAEQDGGAVARIDGYINDVLHGEGGVASTAAASASAPEALAVGTEPAPQPISESETPAEPTSEPAPATPETPIVEAGDAVIAETPVEAGFLDGTARGHPGSEEMHPEEEASNVGDAAVPAERGAGDTEIIPGRPRARAIAEQAIDDAIAAGIDFAGLSEQQLKEMARSGATTMGIESKHLEGVLNDRRFRGVRCVSHKYGIAQVVVEDVIDPRTNTWLMTGDPVSPDVLEAVTRTAAAEPEVETARTEPLFAQWWRNIRSRLSRALSRADTGAEFEPEPELQPEEPAPQPVTPAPVPTSVSTPAPPAPTTPAPAPGPLPAAVTEEPHPDDVEVLRRHSRRRLLRVGVGLGAVLAAVAAIGLGSKYLPDLTAPSASRPAPAPYYPTHEPPGQPIVPPEPPAPPPLRPAPEDLVLEPQPPAEREPEPPFTGNFKVARYPDGKYEFRCLECSDFGHTDVAQDWVRVQEPDGSVQYELAVDLTIQSGGRRYRNQFKFPLPEPGQVADIGHLEFQPVADEE